MFGLLWIQTTIGLFAGGVPLKLEKIVTMLPRIGLIVTIGSTETGVSYTDGGTACQREKLIDGYKAE